MNQKKAKAIRRAIKKTHGYTKSSPTHPVQIVMVPIVKIFTESQFRRAYNRGAKNFGKQLAKMNVILPFDVFFKRVTKGFPKVGQRYRTSGRDGKDECIHAQAADGRRAYKHEKAAYQTLPKKQRAGRYA